MSVLSINAGGVPEHFNLPWYLCAEQNRLKAHNIKLNWHECPGGTGEMTQALRSGRLDVAVLLTEGIVTDIVQGNQSSIVQFYVNSPLRWGVHVKANSPINRMEETEGKMFAISRPKSGSHLMAYVHAQNYDHTIQESNFKVVQNLDGGRKAIKDGTADVFLWEKYTTQPYVNLGELKRIGECPTPWPCFVVAVRNDFLKKNKEEIKKLLECVNQIAKELKKSTSTPELISAKFHLNIEEVRAWFNELEWNTNGGLNEKTLCEVVGTLKQLRIIEDKNSSEILNLIQYPLFEKKIQHKL